MSATNQTTDKTTVPPGYWEDPKGAFIPASRVHEVDKLRDKVVRDLFAVAKKHHQMLREFKLDAMGDFEEFVQASAEKYEQPLRGTVGKGAKGNVTLFSYDGRYKIQRANSDTIAFDERLQVAKGLIDDCIKSWSKGANHNLQAIVTQAFDTDKEGRVNAGRVLSLRRIKIDDPRWLDAMNAIADGTRVSGSKTYLRFYERNDDTGEYLPISLDLASA